MFWLKEEEADFVASRDSGQVSESEEISDRVVVPLNPATGKVGEEKARSVFKVAGHSNVE